MTTMIIDTNKIQALLDDKSISYDHIAEVTGLSKGAIYPYRVGKRDITAMSIEVANKLQSFYEKIKEEKKMDIKIKGLKKAVGEFNKWNEQARIYFDTKELEVWTNVYAGGNESWYEYHDENIEQVVSKAGMVASDNDYLSMRELEQICIATLG